jgi:molybdate/tungstate transport system substrate-binding protein
MKRFTVAALTLLLACAASFADAASPTLRVAYAGSMGVVMDRFAGPAFAKAWHAHYQGIGQGSYGLARLLAGRQLQADVFVAITPGPIEVVRKAGLIGHATPIASTQMVITWSPHSRFAADFKAAAAGHKPWYELLMQPDVRFGRTDPATDPQGRNILFTLQLAARYYQRPGLVQAIAGAPQNPRQIFTEASLLSRLEAGQIDAASGYLSAARSHHLPVIELPDEINLSNPSMEAHWYRHAALTLADGKPLHVQPLVFYAAVLKNARHPKLAKAFIDFLRSGNGQKLLREQGYDAPKGPPL